MGKGREDLGRVREGEERDQNISYEKNSEISLGDLKLLKNWRFNAHEVGRSFFLLSPWGWTLVCLCGSPRSVPD